MEFGSKRTRWTGREATRGGGLGGDSDESLCVCTSDRQRIRDLTPMLLLLDDFLYHFGDISVDFFDELPATLCSCCRQRCSFGMSAVFLRELELEFSSFFGAAQLLTLLHDTCWAVGWCSPSPHITIRPRHTHQPTVPMTPHLSSLFEL